jgi:site-specific recombinase XerD
MASPAKLLQHHFQLWLSSQNYQANTVRNYLADVSRYLSFVDSLPSSDTNPFAPSTISDYVSSLSGDNNASRYLASLNKFCQYALDQKLISTNPVKKIISNNRAVTDHPTLPLLLDQYQLSLQSNKTQTTIKNYINDIRQFISWSDQEN